MPEDEIAAEALDQAADEMVLPGTRATGYYSGHDRGGYQEAENDAANWLHQRAHEIRGERP